MSKHLHRELDKIKKKMLSLGALVEERARMALQAVESREADLAEKIIHSDWEVDEMEVEIEEECLKLLALYQPVAVDLRFIIAIIKINNDLERIGDEAVNIAQRVQVIAKRPPLQFVFDYAPMANRAQDMLKMSLDALVNLDVDLAFKVITMDDEVDKIQVEAYQQIKATIKDNPDRVSYLINLLLISRHLERLADHSTNIAEEVIHLIEGEIVRHGKGMA
ncbi:MAG: phosphate signaling complex protein PhoU [Desulfatitalea sp.]|nr:phosphate signaling complex protein PhoU [Desulfatitalea sp.]NNJ99027.1 phosphate signaling complex protein PhoU [Desulfatitalea sp.]